MHNPLLAGTILGVVGFLIGIAAGEPLALALLGFLLGHGLAIGNTVKTLQHEIDRLRGAAPMRPVDAVSESGKQPVAQPADPIAERSVTQRPAEAPNVPARAVASSSNQTKPDPWAPAPARQGPKPPSRFGTALRSAVGWITGGNVFMKVGIALLFLGVGFLLNYVAGQGFFTLEMRLAAIALASIAGLVVGQRLLRRRREYGLMLQGAAIGVLYLDIFGAFSLYALLPAMLAFGLLAAVSAISAILAVLQRAPALAFAGFAGGFLAPVLASSGSGNHVALFSYYALLNAAILGIAWFRSWRALNLLGFYFTFGIGAVWGADAYRPEMYATTQPFLILFFVFFVAISVLYARRQPPQLRGYVDASLLFATPVLAFTIQLYLMRPFEYGAAWSALAFATYYIALTAFLWRQKRENEQLLVEVFLALGVLLTTLVIPFALGASDTAGAWALEGAGMIWIGLRQQRTLARVLGIALQVAAAVFWLWHHPAQGQQVIINSSYLAGVLIALAGFFSARLYRETPTRWEAPLGTLFVAWFVVWWYGMGYREIGTFAASDHLANWIVGFTAVSALLVLEIAKVWNWPAMRWTSLLAPLPYAVACAYLVFFVGDPPHAHMGWLIWTFGLLAYGWTLLRSEDGVNDAGEFLLACCHVVWAFMVLGYIQWESTWYAIEVLGLEGSWLVAWAAVPPILALQLIRRASFWPIVQWARCYAGVMGATIAIALTLFVISSLRLSGDAAPLPWVPLLNPLDLITLVAAFTVYAVCLDMSRLFALLNHSTVRQAALLGLGIAVFAWLNVTLFRSLHQWQGFPYDLERMLELSYTQTSLSILWVTVGMLLVVIATRMASRTLWISGAVLLAAVVVKLFLQDLANTGSLARIVSFLGVGGMLVVIGYFSPLPPKKTDAQPETGEAAT